LNKRIDYAINFTLGAGESIPARSIEEAAKLYARRVYGRTATAYRASGAAGQPGFFRAYQPVCAEKGAGWVVIGEPFQVG
jgi:hypothetical protein